jgi:transcription elongation GreA/GreB family factor
VSRAFTKEDGDPDDDGLPERPVPLGPNPVTESGLAALKAKVEALKAELKDPARGKRAVERDLRYFEVRLKSAELTKPGEPGVVRFGSWVTLAEPGGGERRVRIVGHDEADAEAGLLSWTSPLSDALLGKAVGDSVPLGAVRLKVLSVS